MDGRYMTMVAKACTPKSKVFIEGYTTCVSVDWYVFGRYYDGR